MAITHTFVSALPDDAADAAAGLVVSSDWNADHDVTNLTLTHGTITADENTLGATVTWNNAAVTFTGINLNVTNTASAAASTLLNLQVGGVSKVSVNSAGELVLGQLEDYNIADIHASYKYTGPKWPSGHGGYQFQIMTAGVPFLTFEHVNLQVLLDDPRLALGWSATSNAQNEDLLLYRDAAATLALRNSTNAQTFRVYGTYTDSSNYVRASLSSSSTAITLAAETAGTGADNVPVNITPSGTEGTQFTNFVQLTEMTAPAAGAANTARIYAVDNGAGKTQLMVIFASGAAQQIAIEP